MTRVLVILDDIWKELKLEDVGIPHEGCKILMSSRNEYVLSREMGAIKNFPIQFLPPKEAWNFSCEGTEKSKIYMLEGRLETANKAWICLRDVPHWKKQENRLHTLVDELKASCLLLEGDNDGSVKMHDVVQSFAIDVASRDHHVLVVADELKEWPTNDVLQQCSGISSPYRKIPDLPAILECPNLRSFILLNKDPSRQIPDNFFREMKELKVLGLTEVNLSPLPSSLQFLENLETLCLIIVFWKIYL
uniref:NB-ARC domain-containing protein n=1 Tax=Populus alba TaxID=43335 RepID=A0A4U5NQF8_POPAL|nr:hypothetical protein D5086_0000249160 [Populus alba]